MDEILVKLHPSPSLGSNPRPHPSQCDVLPERYGSCVLRAINTRTRPVRAAVRGGTASSVATVAVQSVCSPVPWSSDRLVVRYRTVAVRYYSVLGIVRYAGHRVTRTCSHPYSRQRG